MSQRGHRGHNVVDRSGNRNFGYLGSKASAILSDDPQPSSSNVDTNA